MKDDCFEKEQLHFAAQEGNLEKVIDLIHSGFSIDEFDEDLGRTPLHYAAMEEHLKVVACLIQKGANVNARREETIGETALGLIAATCSYDVAKLLINAGANPTIPGWMNLTALDRAKQRKKPEGVKVYELLKAALERFRN